MSETKRVVEKISDRLHTSTTPGNFFEIEAVGFTLDKGMPKIIHEIRRNGVIEETVNLEEGTDPIPYLLTLIETHEFLEEVAGKEGTAK